MGTDERPTDAIGRSGEDKRRIVVGMFDRIAPRYDTMNLLVSFGQTGVWRRRALAGLDLPTAARVLDVGCGTGSVPRFLWERRPDLVVEGMDPSEVMLAQARALDAHTTYFRGDAAAIDRPDGHYQAVTTFYTTRNFADLRPALAELLRVIEPGGSLLVLDSFPPTRRWVGAAQRAWLGHVVPWVVAPFTDADAYRYLGRSIEAHVQVDQLAQMLRDEGCDEVEIEAFSFGAAHCVRATKAA